MLEDRRLNKLSTVAMQCEPAVQDLAIQTEFVAPPVSGVLDLVRVVCCKVLLVGNSAVRRVMCMRCTISAAHIALSSW